MDKRGELLINEEVNRQVIAIVKSGNIKSAKMVIDLMKKILNMAAKKGKSLKEFIEEKKTKNLKYRQSAEYTFDGSKRNGLTHARKLYNYQYKYTHK